MNCSTSTQSVSIPSGVYDLDTLKTECQALEIPATRPNIRRVRRAIDLHKSGAVRPFLSQTPDAFFVHSQTTDKCYCVLPHSGCDCPDAKRMNGDDTYSASWQRIRNTRDRCKHEIAVLMYQEQRADQAKQPDTPADEAEYDAWLCEQYEAEIAASDDSLVHHDPSVDPPIDFP